MPVMQSNQQIIPQYKVYLHKETRNKSFLNVHYYLKSIGIQNNAFFLALYDTDLAGIDPFDPLLSQQMKLKVLRECMFNYWYWLRECARVPKQGGSTSGEFYQLHRGNLALNFLMINCFNVFLEQPRQTGKTTGALFRYLWIFQFGTSNSEIMFIHKNHDGSKDNLAHLKVYREMQPSYLRMDSLIGIDGKKMKVIDRAETLQHPSNGNKIKTLASARNKQMANTLGRGCTQPLQYYDEFAWIIHNKLVYESATPAYREAANNAKRNNAPFGILLTTTPGDMTTAEGEYAYGIRNACTEWSERYYDFSHMELEKIVECNDSSTFFHVIYTYQQLGRGQDYFKAIVKDLNKEWATIRREVLLEWSIVNDNCPFTKEDLDIIQQFCKQPIREVLFGQYRQYRMQIYQEMDLRDGQIIGVDVAGGNRIDSSAITIINAKTTEVIAALNCNYIPVDDLADVIYELVTKYMPNALVVIEKNGVGMGCVGRLIKSSIKKNLYYEIKDKVLEERTNGVTVERGTHRVKSYGLDNSHGVRSRLIELLFQRVEYHKDKFICPILHEEMCGLTYKTSGGSTRVDHSIKTHDDQLFSYLMAIYVWYDCPDLANRFGITRGEILTDSDLEEKVGTLEDLYGQDYEVIDVEKEKIDEDDPVLGDSAAIINELASQKFETADTFLDKQMEMDDLALINIANSPLGHEVISKAYHIDISRPSIYGYNDVINRVGSGQAAINSFYIDDEEDQFKVDNGNLYEKFIQI